MRLFLSSYRAGSYPERMTELFGKGSEVGIITNAKDYKTPEERQQSVSKVLSFISSLALKPAEIDLRDYFDVATGLEKRIRKYQSVWMAGGNVFLLRRALKYSGLDKFLYDRASRNEIILGGESAGAIIMGPTLRYSEVDTDEDSPNYIPEGYDREVIWEGLGLISYVPVPHFQTLGYIGIDDYIKNLDKENIPYRTMTDDQAIVINGDKEEFLK